MANFVVTYRAEDGSLKDVGYEADDRKALFRQLSDEGRVAVSVREGTLGKAKRKASGSAGNNGAIKAVLGLGAVAFAAFCLWFFFKGNGKDGAVKGKDARGDSGKPQVTLVKEKQVQLKKNAADIAREFNDEVKEFVKKTPGTNKVSWITPPLDPDDPDNALRTRVAQELGSLLSIEPGERMPPFPYSFLLEDDMKAAAERGEDVGKIENGNKMFLESLKKWKITAKETDDERRLEHKSNILEAQAELLAGMDEGISVNDSIRAAYEFRQRAYEMRSTIIKTMAEFHAEGDSQEDIIRQIKDMNKRLEEEGIKKIAIGEVIPDYEEEE